MEFQAFNVNMLILCDDTVITEMDTDFERVLISGRGVDALNITVHIILTGDSDINDARIQKYLL